MQNFMRFHAIESEPRLSEEFGEKRNSSTLYWDMYSQTASLLFLMIHIPYINLCAISLNRNRKQHIPKIPKKVTLQRHLLNDFYQKLIDINLPLDNTKYKISLNSVRSRFLVDEIAQKFLCKISINRNNNDAILVHIAE